MAPIASMTGAKSTRALRWIASSDFSDKSASPIALNKGAKSTSVLIFWIASKTGDMSTSMFLDSMACMTGDKSKGVLPLIASNTFSDQSTSSTALGASAKSMSVLICLIASSTGDKSTDTRLLFMASMIGANSCLKSMSFRSRIASSTGDKSTSGCSRMA